MFHRISSISPNDLANLKFQFPKLTDQKKIADTLSSLNNKIELNNQINSDLEAMAKLVYDYWFVQFDFPIPARDAKAMGKPELEGKPYKASGGKMVFNEALKREIPEGWGDGILSDIADITMGQSPSGRSYNINEEGTVFYQGSTDFGWPVSYNKTIYNGTQKDGERRRYSFIRKSTCWFSKSSDGGLLYRPWFGCFARKRWIKMLSMEFDGIFQANF